MDEPPRAPPPDYASWPFHWIAAYGQMTRNLGRYTGALLQSTDAMEAARAEADLGMTLFGDMARAYWELALAPWTAMASVMTQQAASMDPFRTAPAPAPERD